MKFPVVKNRKYYFLRIFVLITLGFCLLAIFSLIDIVYLIVPLFQFIPFFISPNFFYQPIGKMEFEEENIIISTESKVVIKNQDIISIKIFLSDPRRFNKSTKWIVKGWVLRIVIEAKEGFLNSYRLMLNREEKEKLTQVLEKLYLKGVKIFERDELGAKYFLLKGNLSYNEIQSIKEKYKLVW
ncbi:MAG: hypothetical protein GYA14_01975 [Ignavibacteria bacterium]|nr:hypothetical protein [Ignavibacteria bacterium]